MSKLISILSIMVFISVNIYGVCPIDTFIRNNYYYDASAFALDYLNEDGSLSDQLVADSVEIELYLKALNSVFNSGHSCVDTIFTGKYAIKANSGGFTRLVLRDSVKKEWVNQCILNQDYSSNSQLYSILNPLEYTLFRVDSINSEVAEVVFESIYCINIDRLMMKIENELGLYCAAELHYPIVSIGYTTPNWNDIDSVHYSDISCYKGLPTIKFQSQFVDKLSNYPLGNQFYEFTFDTTCNAKLLRTHYADYTKEASQTVFPTDSAIWNNEGDTWLGNHRFGICGDTIIESKTYSKIYILRDTTLNTQPEDYIGGLREEGKKIFVRMLNTPEFVLYDFNLSESDTMRYNYMSYTGDPKDLVQEDHFMVVKSIGTETIYNGESRRSIQFETKKWIEGIGSTLGCALFDPIMAYPLNGKTYSIACLKYKNDILFLNPLKCQECFCTIKTQVNEPVDASELHDIFPNPTSGKLQINKSNFTSYQVYSLNGKVVLHGVLNNREIDISSLPRGIYLLKLRDINGSLVPIKIVKN